MSPPKAVCADSAYSSAETKAKPDAHDSKMVRNSQKTSSEIPLCDFIWRIGRTG